MTMMMNQYKEDKKNQCENDLIKKDMMMIINKFLYI